MTEPADKTLTAQVVSWAAGQPFNNVLLIAILLAIGWLGHYAITKAIPDHLQTIQNGYKEIEQSHREERERTMETFDRWLRREAPSSPSVTAKAK